MIHEDNTIGFELGDYNHGLELVIDPILDYASFLGGTGYDVANGVAVDEAGNSYLTGYAASAAFPTTGGPLDSDLDGVGDGFLTILDPTGIDAEYSTFFGGTDTDRGVDVALDALGNIYIAGNSGAQNWDNLTPISFGAGGNKDAFVAKFTVPLPASELWISTLDDVAASGAPGLNSWTDGEALSLANPNLALEPGTTNGTFSSVFNLDDFAAGGDADIDAIHYVGTNVTVGGNAEPSVALQVGDVLLSTADSESLSNTNSLAVDENDVFVFRPDTPGDYSSGTFIFLLDLGPLLQNGGTDVTAVSLVERSTTVGDATLDAGTFLIAQDQQRIIRYFTATDVGLGTTSGAYTNLIHGPDINLGSEIRGLDLIEVDTLVGGTFVPVGRVLVTLKTDRPSATWRRRGGRVLAADRRDLGNATPGTVLSDSGRRRRGGNVGCHLGGNGPVDFARRLPSQHARHVNPDLADV